MVRTTAPSDRDVLRDVKTDVNGMSLKRLLDLHHLDDLDLEILCQFRTWKPIKGLKLTTNKSQRTIYRKVNALHAKKLIDCIKDSGIGHFKATPGGQEVIDICVDGSEPRVLSPSGSTVSADLRYFWIRSHNLSFLLPILTKPRNLEFLLEKGNWVMGLKVNEKFRNSKLYYGVYEFQGFQAYIVITTRNLIVRLREIWSKDVMDAYAQAGQMVLEIKKELEEIFSPASGRVFRLGKPERRHYPGAGG